MKYTNKDVLAIRDHANLLLKESGNSNELFVTISQCMFKIWNRNDKVETELVGHSTIDETYRWFEGFKVAMSYNRPMPTCSNLAKPVDKMRTTKTTIMSKLIGFFNQI
jgi:hypothetical protein